MSTRTSLPDSGAELPLRSRVQGLEERSDHHDYVAGKVASIDACVTELAVELEEVKIEVKASRAQLDRVEKRTRKRPAEAAAVAAMGLALKDIVEASVKIEQHPYGLVVLGFVVVAVWWVYRREHEHVERPSEK